MNRVSHRKAYFAYFTTTVKVFTYPFGVRGPLSWAVYEQSRNNGLISGLTTAACSIDFVCGIVFIIFGQSVKEGKMNLSMEIKLYKLTAITFHFNIRTSFRLQPLLRYLLM